MPLMQSVTEVGLHENIMRLMKEGKPRNQAVAIAYQIQKEAREKADNQNLELESEGFGCAYQNNKHGTNQAGSANPLGFVYGGVNVQNEFNRQQIQNQYPYG